MKTFWKPSFTHFFQKMAPGGGGYQISPDVALTTCIHLYPKKYPKNKSLDSNGMFSGFSAPKIGGILIENFFKTLIYPFFPKMAPRGGGLTRFHQMWH